MISRDILALIGDFYHDSDYIRNGLEDVIDGLEKTVDFETDPAGLDWKNLENYDLFVIVKEGLIDPENSDEIWMDEEQDEAIRNYVKEGGGVLALHCALANYPPDSSFRGILKGNFVSHPSEHPEVTFEVLDKSHPIASHIDTFSVIDEQYFVEVDEEETDIFLRGSSKDHGESPAGWAHCFGEGRVCCITPGHNSEVLANPMLEKLLRNAIRWIIE